MKGSALPIFLIIIAVVLVLGMVSFIYFRSSPHISINSSNTTTYVTPDIPVKDFAPSLQMGQKTTVLIQLSDSSMEKYVVPTDQVNTYIKNLPAGYRVVSKTP